MNLLSPVHPELQVSSDPVRERLTGGYRAIRRLSEELCHPLSAEDYPIQSMPDVSPPKWHLAHTTWFFENFILASSLPNYERFDPSFHYLFNSYYKGLGPHLPRQNRGLLSRPETERIYEYRHHVDQQITNLLENASAEVWEQRRPVLELGLHHEQQHQELLLMDIKHIYFSNPLRPIYRSEPDSPERESAALQWIEIPEDCYQVGAGAEGFSFDNERPRHRIFLENFRLASRPVSNGEYLEFMSDGGYQNPLLWLSDGWDRLQSEAWEAPLYWEKGEAGWQQMTLSGMRPLNPAEPVCHVSYYEADAFARWAGCRLPTEFEWEVAAQQRMVEGNFLESGRLHPRPEKNRSGSGFCQLFGDVWEWTRSAYAPYPKFRAFQGTLAEYNEKFMCNQLVLRGGSCLTPCSHFRISYRNFFPPHSRWQCGGMRLAED